MDYEKLRVTVSKGTGIPLQRLQLYSLLNEPSINIADYFYDGEYLSGYAVKIGTRNQFTFVINEDGYKDIEIFNDKDA
jgi:coproporphyrinogen III oxidase-like Fe-S oxidoreductase